MSLTLKNFNKKPLTKGRQDEVAVLLENPVRMLIK